VLAPTNSIMTVTLNPAVDKTLEVPGFQVGMHAQARVKALVPSGKGVNVARGIVRLGGKAVACALLGRNEERMFAQSLSAEGVETRLRIVAGCTRTNTTVLDPEAHTATHLREPGFKVEAEDIGTLQVALADWLATRGEATVVFGGSLPPGMSPADFAALIAACAKLGARVFVDTSGPALQAALGTGLVHALKPNLLELGECLHGSVEAKEGPSAARELLDRVGIVLLTLGAEGAFLIGRGAVVGARCRIPDSDVRNTVGCGDAFLAGWLRGEQLCDDPAEALRWAVATGAASARSETTVGYRLADVEALMPCCELIR